MRRVRTVACCLLAASTLAVPRTEAATTTGVIAVSAVAVSVCLLTPSALVFGNYVGEELDANATLTVTCSLGTSYDIGLNPGATSGATVSTRQMRFLTNTLDYALYQSAARTTNWGNTIGTDTVSGTGSGLPQILTVYGRIPEGQFITPGAYVDSVTATLTY